MSNSESRSRLMSKPFLILLYSVESWSLYLHARQCEFIARNGLPDVLKSSVSDGDYRKIRLTAAFRVVTNMAAICSSLYTCSRTLSTGSPTSLWNSTAMISGNAEFRAIVWTFADDLMQNIITLPVMVVLSVFRKDVKRGPFEVLFGGALWLLVHAIGAALRTMILIRATNNYGSRIMIYLSVLVETITILSTVVLILTVAPILFPKIPEGPYKTEIDAVCLKAGYYPQHGVYLEPMKDGVTDQPNAYHAGILGTSMIVVSESLLKIVSPRDIAAVVAHELGHWNGSHSVFGFLANLAANVTFTISAMWSFGNEDFFELLKFDQADPPHPILGVLLFSKFLYPSIGNIIIGAKHTTGYFCEYAADSYAFKMGLGTELAVSLVRLFEKILHFPHGDPWYTAWTTAHPSIVRRIENINELKSS